MDIISSWFANHFWCLFLLLLGALLLGLLLGWLLWYGFKKRVQELQKANDQLRVRVTDLEKELASLRYSKEELEKANSETRIALNRCEADRSVMQSKLALAESNAVDTSNDGIVASAGNDDDVSIVTSAGNDGDDLSGKYGSSGLAAISGMNDDAMTILEKNGIGSVDDLAKADDATLGAAFEGTKHNWYYYRNQAGYAASGDWDGLNGYKTNNYAMAFRNDNLQIVEGVGPKIEGLLKKDGIKTWGAFAGASTERLQGILDAAGPNYRMHDPKTWSEQAKLADEGKWEELIKYQKFLDTGRETTGDFSSPSKAEKMMVKLLGITANPDDLKVVEGIGPKIESLLKAGGIDNWSDLAKAPVSRIKKILSDAGDRYRLAVPDTWPKQAELAEAGKWAELREYQDYLDGGKDLAKS